MYLNAVLAPFLGSALAGQMGRWLGARGSGCVTILGQGTSTLLSYVIFYEIRSMGSAVVLSQGSWFGAHTVTVEWLLCFDPQSAAMMVTVCTVSFCVHIYSLGYMQNDPHLPRFQSYQSQFTGSMLLQVTANDLLTLMVGWEMIGVCSYLLIGFWFHRLSRTKRAQKAMQVNRVSDTVLLFGLFLCWWYQGSTDTSLLTATSTSAYYADWICFALLGGALGKSAQVGLHVWQADAMEGFLQFLYGQMNIYRFFVLLFRRRFWLQTKRAKIFLPQAKRYMVFVFVGWWRGMQYTTHLFNSFRNIHCTPNNSTDEKSFRKFEMGVIVGQMLRDGSLQNNYYEKNPLSKRNRRLAMCMARDVLYYQNWLRTDLLSRYFTRALPTPYPKNNPTQYGLYSRSLPCFTNIYKQWYQKKDGIRIQKVPTLAYLKKHFREVSLAHWIMNDGYWDGTVIL